MYSINYTFPSLVVVAPLSQLLNMEGARPSHIAVGGGGAGGAEDGAHSGPALVTFEIPVP